MSSGEVEAREKLAELLELEEGLSEWEVDFIERLSHQRGQMSEKQRAKVAEIWAARLG